MTSDGRGLTRPQAIRARVEMALSSSAPRPTVRNPARAARAVELAASVIAKHLADVPAKKREARRRELLHGPSGFRNVRKGHPVRGSAGVLYVSRNHTGKCSRFTHP